MKNGMDSFDCSKLCDDAIFRSMGGPGSKERIGAGIIRKSGVHADFVNVDYPHFALVYVLRGRGRYIDADGKTYPLETGNYFFRFPGTVHSTYIDPASNWVECFLDLGRTIHFALKNTGIVNLEQPVGMIGIHPHIIKRFEEFAAVLKRAAEEELSGIMADLIKLLTEILILERHDTARRGEPGVIEEACRVLGANLNRPFDLKKYCRQIGCGYEKFRKMFVRRIGVPPKQYRIRRRTDLACQMLNTSGRSIAEIADALGYSSPFEFSLQFKKYVGTAPSHFRSQTGSDGKLKTKN